jgi:hypothetical protein
VGLFTKTDEEAQPVTLGKKYRDKISGFEGVATGRFEFLHGCVRVNLETGKDGECKEGVFDEQRLEPVAGTPPIKPTATSGGPLPNPPSRDPSR